MRLSWLFPALLLSPLLAFASPARLEKRFTEDGNEELSVPDLKELTPEDFDSTIERGYWFIKHFSPYCGHCKIAAPVWWALYEFYLKSSPASPSSPHPNSPPSFTETYDWHFANVDCAAHGDMCNDHGVQAYPTFSLFKDGQLVDKFEGKTNSVELLSKFIEKHLEEIKPGSRPAKLDLPTPMNVVEFGEFLKAHGKDPNPKLPPKTAKKPKKQKVVDYEPDLQPETKHTTETKETPVKSTKTKLVKPNKEGISFDFDPETFGEKIVEGKEGWFVKFYAPWCSHCQAMAPAWKSMASQMQDLLNVGEVNCEVQKRLCKEAGVNSYPTIMYFQGGDKVEYRGLRGLGDLVSWARKAADSEVKELGDAADLESIQKEHEVLFLYFYDHATVTEDFDALARLTMPLIGHAPIYKTNSDLLARKYRITTKPQLVVIRDDTPTYYPALSPADIRNNDKIVEWMKSVWLPMVPELSATNSHEIMNGRTVVLGIFDTSNESELATAKAEMKEAAKNWLAETKNDEKLERQELRDKKKHKIDEAEERGDEKAVEAAKESTVVLSDKKIIGFAWVDGVFWERWIKSTYGIDVKEVGNRVIINDEDNKVFWDIDEKGNTLKLSRNAIIDLLKTIVKRPESIKSKSTIGTIERVYRNAKDSGTSHPFLTIFVVVCLAGFAYFWRRGRQRRTYTHHHAGMGLNPGNMKESGWMQGWLGGEKEGYFGGNGGGGKFD